MRGTPSREGGEQALYPDSNATHMVAFDEPPRFNAEVDRFFRAPFVKRDRIKDFMSSFEKMRAAQQPR